MTLDYQCTLLFYSYLDPWAHRPPKSYDVTIHTQSSPKRRVVHLGRLHRLTRHFVMDPPVSISPGERAYLWCGSYTQCCDPEHTNVPGICRPSASSSLVNRDLPTILGLEILLALLDGWMSNEGLRSLLSLSFVIWYNWLIQEMAHSTLEMTSGDLGRSHRTLHIKLYDLQRLASVFTQEPTKQIAGHKLLLCLKTSLKQDQGRISRNFFWVGSSHRTDVLISRIISDLRIGTKHMNFYLLVTW